MNTTKQSNKLINETSPYLLQHAYNPVDWFPWSTEAFDKSKAEKKPIFLSIGYSTCHWCHVMERESFEDDQVAEYLNAHFISIKVDKEERPDIDAVYMNVCQALTGGGGWPLTIIMTPDQKPFYAGTYLPKNNNYGRRGLMELLEIVVKQWKESPKKLYSAGEEITAALSRPVVYPAANSPPSRLPAQKAARYFSRAFDPQYGGFGRPPKFPTPHNLMFLLRFYLLTKDDSALKMVETTLQQMYRGGIFDHAGFGFSRYSTDDKWLVPHFEKMLYDNALLAIVYFETYQVTKTPLYKEVGEKTLSYIQREMTSPEGSFYSAQDADSQGEEGRFYTFTQGEIQSVLGGNDGERFCHRFGVTPQGNFEGKNILNLIENPEYNEVDPDIDGMLPRIREFRRKRAVLHKDDKVLTSWNALMIVAYLKAYRALSEEKYLEIATRAIGFIRSNLTDRQGNLLVSYRDQAAKGRGLLDDYAYVIWAYLEMYEVTFNAEYLDMSRHLAQKAIDLFADEKGGFFMNAAQSDPLIYRPKEQYDGAMPSGNSVFAYCLSRLSAFTGKPEWSAALEQQLTFYHTPFAEAPYAYSFALLALMQAVYPTKEVVCVVKSPQDELEAASALRG
ncbi:MAG: thioredoxin domain-containing protein, partial [Oscillospiraceae bacterium]|nr:thioredoxin domain-containing protein [Oscillospiraceae bacterium]